MTLMAFLNVIFAAGVIVMVVTPLVWAIVAQTRAEHPSAANIAANATGRTLSAQQSQHRGGAHRQYTPAAGRA